MAAGALTCGEDGAQTMNAQHAVMNNTGIVTLKRIVKALEGIGART